jgi:hypothetical protein
VPSSSVVSGDRLVVETGVWSSGGATAKSVTDSAGDQFVELLHYNASEGTEMSVWTAPVTAGGGTKPTITVTPTAKADVGVAALEYSGLSSVADATVVDRTTNATGTTSGAGSVASGATVATIAGNELALGFYTDSGFGDKLTPGSGYTARVNVSNTSDIELLAEDQGLPASGATPNAGAGTGASTTWLMATVVLKSASGTSGAAATSSTGAATSALIASPLLAHSVFGPHASLPSVSATTASRAAAPSRSGCPAPGARGTPERTGAAGRVHPSDGRRESRPRRGLGSSWRRCSRASRAACSVTTVAQRTSAAAGPRGSSQARARRER